MPHQTRRLAWIILLGCTLAFAIAWWSPIHSAVTKLGLLGSFTGILISLLVLCWRWKMVRFSLIGTPLVLLAAFVFWPGKGVDRAIMQERYLRTMLAYHDVPYVWGGENSRGIDCSGLPRRALREAMWREGLRTRNGTLVREAALQWWHDASAKALRDGYRGYAVALDTKGTIHSMPYNRLEPGDLAITDDGRHVMVYFGGEDWIQADPGLGKVAILNGRKADNLWFDEPVQVFRWRRLDSGAGES